MEHGSEIGTIEVIENAPIPEKTPQQLDPSAFTNENLRFDNWWTVESTGEKLNEGGIYDYGDNISVYANWRKKLQTLIWCYDETPENITRNLRDKVWVIGGSESGQAYSYISPSETATLTADVDTKNVTVSNGQSYMFLGWSLSTPEPTSRNVFESSNSSYRIGPNINFDANYLKTYYACFLKGTEIRIKIKTNQSSLNDNGIQYNYTLNGRTIPKLFSNTFFSMQQSDFGSVFTCTQNQETPSGTIYKFKGWYIGDYDDPNVIPSGTILNDSVDLLAIRSQIVVTAIYLPSTTNNYTITYYSGL